MRTSVATSIVVTLLLSWGESRALAAGDPNGVACQSDATCASGHCVDLVCCDSACTGQCEACGESGSEGTCVPIKGTPRGQRPLCANSTNVCGGSCDGINRTSCAFPPAGKPCGSSCDNGTATPRACDGQGSCADQPPIKCVGNFGCTSQGTCNTTCASSADCAGGYSCAGGACVAATSCADDHTIRAPSGDTSDCAPYACAGGACLASCANDGQCASPATCDLGSRQCVAAADAGAGSGGGGSSGGCAIGAGRSGTAGIAALALFACLARRRRAR